MAKNGKRNESHKTNNETFEQEQGTTMWEEMTKLLTLSHCSYTLQSRCVLYGHCFWSLVSLVFTRLDPIDNDATTQKSGGRSATPG